mmetsp:Transcript_1461/g.3925  ORF Transcript_1461/g.3925 Transcript_1461/m.3925 type:complete len:86 (-) Transcript_1461:6-263(-)
MSLPLGLILCMSWVASSYLVLCGTNSPPSDKVDIAQISLYGWRCDVLVQAGGGGGRGRFFFLCGDCADGGSLGGPATPLQYRYKI